MTEFSRTFRIDTLGAGAREVSIEAEEAERAALAKRFGLQAIGALAAQAALTRSGDSVRASGRVIASVVQSCVATGEPVEEEVAEEFEIEFRPNLQVTAPDEEIELSGSELDVVFYEGSAVDLGEAVAETVSLALNPFPRSPQAEKALREAGVKSEEEAKREASPFAGLAALKDKLGG
ncbi:MAG TPA: YceD family protein [Allosphingosinicella sp.]|jgi:uncharacterized metal-binding protein YceD (DUF177 family)